LALVSCGNDDEPMLRTSLELTELIVELDGNEVQNIIIRDFQMTFHGSDFTYTTDQGQKSGTWEISEDETVLNISYDTESFSFPLISNSEEEITFIVITIDLSKADLTLEEQQIVLLVNQELAKSGSSWNAVSNAAQRLDILFTLNYK